MPEMDSTLADRKAGALVIMSGPIIREDRALLKIVSRPTLVVIASVKAILSGCAAHVPGIYLFELDAGPPPHIQNKRVRPAMAIVNRS